MKIYKFLFETVNETEEYYLQHHKVSGKLNPKVAKELYDVYSKLLKRKTQLFAYDPEGVTVESAEESGFPLDRGALEPVGSFAGKLVYIMPAENRIYIPSEKFLFDPRLHVQFQSLQQVFPEFDNFSVVTTYDNETSLGTLNSLLSGSQDVSGTFPRHISRYEQERINAEKEESTGETFEPEFQEFKFKVLKDITTIPWYHATRRSNLNSIKKTGLIPSKDFQHVQERGWTVLNFDLQNAVYLTMNYEHAKDIAKTLASRYEETGIVLEIDGSVLKNTKNVVVDEDALRNDFDGNVTINPAKGMPNYIESVLHSVESIGYSKTIPPKYIKFKWSTNSEKTNRNNNSDENI